MKRTSSSIPRPGNCYQTAFNRLRDLHFKVGSKGWYLVHGVCLGTGEFNKNKPMGHAWLESENDLTVWDPTGRIIPRPIYYLAGRVQGEPMRFTWAQAMRRCIAHRNYGPWNPEIKKAEESWLPKQRRA